MPFTLSKESGMMADLGLCAAAIGPGEARWGPSGFNLSCTQFQPQGAVRVQIRPRADRRYFALLHLPGGIEL